MKIIMRGAVAGVQRATHATIVKPTQLSPTQSRVAGGEHTAIPIEMFRTASIAVSILPVAVEVQTNAPACNLRKVWTAIRSNDNRLRPFAGTHSAAAPVFFKMKYDTHHVRKSIRRHQLR